MNDHEVDEHPHDVERLEEGDERTESEENECVDGPKEGASGGVSDLERSGDGPRVEDGKHSGSRSRNRREAPVRGENSIRNDRVSHIYLH